MVSLRVPTGEQDDQKGVSKGSQKGLWSGPRLGILGFRIYGFRFRGFGSEGIGVSSFRAWSLWCVHRAVDLGLGLTA